MSKRNADILQVLIGEMPKDGDVDFIIGKTLCVLSETNSRKPVRNIRHVVSRSIGPRQFTSAG